jgi:hypothetical protein
VPRFTSTLALTVAASVAIGLVGTGVASARKLGLGDSVMQGASNELRSRNFKVNTTTSRQFSEAPGVLRRLERRGRLPRTVVIHLGNNGYIEPSDCRRAVKVAGNRRVFLVTVKVPRSWRTANNARLKKCARRHDARIVDWYAFSHGHDAWFYSDGFHLTPSGQRKYARFLARET